MKDWCYGFAAKLIGFCVSLLPRSAALILGGWLGIIVYWFAKEHRNLACKHIHQSIDVSDADEIKVIAKRCFENLGKTVVEFMRFPRLKVEKIRKYVKIVVLSMLRMRLQKAMVLY